MSPVRSQLQTPWKEASGRTKRYYTRKASQAVSAVVNDISPNESGPLFNEVVSSEALKWQFPSDDDSEEVMIDKTLMTSLADCYRAADNWSARRQILSIIADKMPYKKLASFIPGLTKHRYTEAKRHSAAYGSGAPVPTTRVPRQDFSTPQIEHFIGFITSSHIIQDLPFGERSITLSNKDTIKVPNVIRTIIPERVVQQYLAYCDESGFQALSRSTLLRILQVCSASTRKSLQGLDYVSSMGAEAFEDLSKVVEKLGDGGQGMDWAKDVQHRLRTAKRYLKTDYKVGYGNCDIMYHPLRPRHEKMSKYNFNHKQYFIFF